MGTSKSYSAKIKGQPQWGKLSLSVTTHCSPGTILPKDLGTILNKYVNIIGGSSQAGSGKSNISGKAGIETAKRLGGFLGTFSSSGGSLQDALNQSGFPDLSGKTLSDVLNHLLEYCSGPSSSLDDVAAKAASERILEELVADATTIEEFQTNLQKSLDQNTIEDILIKYFGYYIFEHLSKMFYEKLLTEKGKLNCANLFRQIKEFIIEKLRNISRVNTLKNMNWNSKDATELIKNIQEDVLQVFE